MSEEKPELSLEELTAAIELNPNDAEGYINRASYFYKKEEYIPALNDLNYSIKINPGYANAYHKLCELYFDIEEYELSFKNIDKAISFLKHKQHIKNDNSVSDGAIAGSFPIWGRYSMFEYPNWAAKFFADALIIDAEKK